jgi:hypothetical protein
MAYGKLVVSMAAKYRRAPQVFDDLVSAGFLGLMDAINHFDLTREGVRLGTYANTKGVPPALPGRQSKFDVSGGMPRLSIDETPEREPPKHTHMEFHRWTNTKA